jgi:hypothetical protein
MTARAGAAVQLSFVPLRPDLRPGRPGRVACPTLIDQADHPVKQPSTARSASMLALARDGRAAHVRRR